MSVYRSLFFAALLALACLGQATSSYAADKGADRFAAAIEATKAAMMADPQDALKKSEAAVALAGQMPDTKAGGVARATAQWLNAEALIGLNRLDDAARAVGPAVALAERHGKGTKLHGDLLRSRGAVSALTGKIQPALVDYLAAHRIFRALGEKRSEAIALQDIGQIYWEAGDYDRVLRYLADANELYSADPGFALSNHNTQAETLRMMGRGAEAERQFELALKHARALKSPVLETRILSNLALVQADNNRLAVASTNADRALQLAQGPEAADWRSFVFGVKAKIAAKTGKNAVAAKLLTQTFAGVNLDKTDMIYRDFHELAAQVYERTGQLPLANAHLKAFNRLDREASKLISTASTQVLAAEFDFANQNLRITQLKQGQLERDIKIERQRVQFRTRLFTGLGLAGLVVLALILASYVSIRRSRNKVSAANAVLQSTNSELQHALRAKSDFLAMTSHEIRTPLNGIMGMTQVILANSGLDGKVREQMTLLSRSGKAMQTLVDDLLDTAKLETGEIKLTQAPVDIAAVVTEAVNLWREQANAKGLALNLRIDDMPRQVVTDGARVRQIILNLMSNAVKFTDAGEIAVRLTAGDGADRFVIAVTDSGIGIPADQQAKIFDEFHQVDSGTSRNHGGTGLGLAISSKLAKALGGDLSVESSEGAGSTFIISLPLVAVATTAKRSTPPQSLSDMRVGLVEANEMKRTIIQGLIQPRVAEVIGTGDHGGALMLLEQSNVDMMIIEAHSMAPEPEQQHLLTSFISAAKDQKTSTIVLLPKESHLSAETIANAGADRVLVKPIDGTSLIDALHSIQSEIAIYYKTVTIKAA